MLTQAAALAFVLQFAPTAAQGNCSERRSYPWQGGFAVTLVHRDVNPLVANWNSSGGTSDFTF